MTRKEESENAARALAETKIDDRGYHQCLYDFGMGVEWADTHPQWVSVEEAFPPKDGVYLVCTTDGSVQLAYHYTGLEMSDAVTHWMPIPQPPKKGGEE